MDQLRLLFVTAFYKPAYVYGGPVRSISALCEGLASLGCQVTVYTTNANGRVNFSQEIPCTQVLNGVHVQYFERDLPGSYFVSNQLGKACYHTIEQFDLVYVGSTWAYPFLPACRAARSKLVPYVVTPRTSFMKKTWNGTFAKKRIYHQLFERSLITSASALHYTSTLEKRESAWLNMKTDTFIVSNPVELSEFERLPIRGSFRQRYGISEDEFILLFLGRIEHRKGLDLSLAAFAQAAKTLTQIKFVIAGPEEDGYLKDLRRMTAELNISDQVVFTGFLNSSQRLSALVDADLFILTSYSENFGMAVVESMAAGLPVLISDQVGIADLIQETDAGCVVPLDVSAIAAQIIKLRGRLSENRIGMQQNARKAAQTFSPGRIAQTMMEQFEEILHKKQVLRVI